MSNTEKELSSRDASQTQQATFNEQDFSTSISGFLVPVVGRLITVTYPSATTEVYAFSENGIALYTLTLTYTDATKDSLSTAERTA